MCAKNRFILIISLLALAVSCKNSVQEVGSARPVVNNENRMILAFGSCAHEYDEQLVWYSVADHDPDIWIWLGDIVYGDTKNMDLLRRKYATQKSKPGYQELLKSTPVIGVWDDHDYGRNGAGKEFTAKYESRVVLFEYLGVPYDDPKWSREGAYNSYLLEKGGRSVKIILLDGRYFRDDPEEDSADILGDDQWAWLEAELMESSADLNIIGSGIQVIPEEQEFEKWANFPVARERLFDLLVRIDTAPTLFISGDRHFAEISKKNIEGLEYPLYDFTSSGLTHSYQDLRLEINLQRVGYPVPLKNFGLIIIDWGDTPKVSFQIRGIDNKILFIHEPELF